MADYDSSCVTLIAGYRRLMRKKRREGLRKRILFLWDLRVSRRHVISALHNAPDLPTNGRVAERHDGQRQDENQEEHVDLVDLPQEPSFGITNAPVCD